MASQIDMRPRETGAKTMEGYAFVVIHDPQPLPLIQHDRRTCPSLPPRSCGREP
jgi:hypothetical protein